MAKFADPQQGNWEDDKSIWLNEQRWSERMIIKNNKIEKVKKLVWDQSSKSKKPQMVEVMKPVIGKLIKIFEYQKPGQKRTFCFQVEENGQLVIVKTTKPDVAIQFNNSGIDDGDLVEIRRFGLSTNTVYEIVNPNGGDAVFDHGPEPEDCPL